MRINRNAFKWVKLFIWLSLICSSSLHANPKVLRVVAHADLKILDPTYTTAYVTRNMGHMVYDTLFSLDKHGIPQPQMVKAFKVSRDGLLWNFSLKPNLKFSDGSDVTSKDVIASLQRWMQKDNLGQLMQDSGLRLQLNDDKNFSFYFKKPFGLVLDALARPSSYPPFIYPERLALHDLKTPLQETLGSGPYIFKKNEWIPGKKAVFVKNPFYSYPHNNSSGLSGNKSPKFDRVEWVYIPDSRASVAALKRGEVDYIEQIAPDYIDPLRSETDIKIIQGGPYQAFLVFNFLFPPFDNPKVRQAVQMALQQETVVSAMGFPSDMRVHHCATYFLCGGSNATEAGAEAFLNPSIEKAQALLKESGYRGEKVVLLVPTDVIYLSSGSLIAAQTLRSLGMDVEIQSSDWATLTVRRTKRLPLSEGGWSAYFSVASGVEATSPVTSMLGPPCGSDEPGWACDNKLDALRQEWIQATDHATRTKALEAFHRRAFEVIPYAIAGQYSTASAIRKNVKGSDQLWSGMPNVWTLDK